MTTKILIDFACTDVCGLLVEHPTGVLWSNQTGGTACAHPECEGFYVPLGRAQMFADVEYPFESQWWLTSAELEKVDSWCVKPYDREAVQAWIDSVPDLATVLKPRDSYEGWWGENWIPVRVRDGLSQFDCLSGLGNKLAILTMQNSD